MWSQIDTDMKNEKSDSVMEDKGEKISPEPLDHDEIGKRKRSKWLRWLLNIVDNIVTALT
jgi:hypothetical protein